MNNEAMMLDIKQLYLPTFEILEYLLSLTTLSEHDE
jgi:hypothetical protein